uniref:Uncharacterized protein n=1 Tax=Setaria italica TaxID=4555 RepID=K3ZG52_SETIT
MLASLPESHHSDLILSFSLPKSTTQTMVNSSECSSAEQPP